MDVLCNAKVTGKHKSPATKAKCPACGPRPRRSSIASAKPESGGTVRKNRDSVNYLDARGELHREGGPAIVEYHPNGSLKREAWMRHGRMMDRGNEPNIVEYDRDGWGKSSSWNISVEHEGYTLIRLHREGGPAAVSESKNSVTSRWYENGKRVGEGPDGEAMRSVDPQSGEVIKQEWIVPEGGTGLVSRHRPTISPRPNEVWMVNGERFNSRSKAYAAASGIDGSNDESIEYLMTHPIEDVYPGSDAVMIAQVMAPEMER